MIRLHAFSVVHNTEDHPRQHVVMLAFIYEDHVIINFIETLLLEVFFYPLTKSSCVTTSKEKYINGYQLNNEKIIFLLVYRIVYAVRYIKGYKCHCIELEVVLG